MKAKKSTNYDFITSLASARSFHDVAKACLATYEETGKIKPTQVFVSATNYGLSIELYLKSILVMHGETRIRGHMLDELYMKINETSRKRIEQYYNEMGGKDRRETLYLRASLEGSQPTNKNKLPKRGVKLDQVIKNNRDMFVMYRYMFTKGRTKQWEYFFFEYGNLDLVAKALEKHAHEFLKDHESNKVNRT